MNKLTVEEYMAQHQFPEADKKKVRDYLKESQAIDAYLTKDKLFFTDRFGEKGEVFRVSLGLQDNFV